MTAATYEVCGNIQLDRIKFKWEIENFREKTQNLLISRVFRAPTDQTKWCLVLFRDGDTKGSKGWISLFLQLNEHICPIKVSCALEIVCPQSNSVTRKFTEIFENEIGQMGNCRGYPKFIERETCTRFLKNNQPLTINCELTFMEQNKNMMPDTEKLLSNHEKLFAAGDYNDCTLVCGDVEVPACKFLLASQSPVFHAMFLNDSEEAKTGRVKIDDIRAEVMQELARFTAGGKLQNKQLVEEVLIAADKYEINTLKRMCAVKMVNSLTKENICRRLAIADRHHIKNVKKAAIDFLKRNRIDVKELPDFKHLIIPEHQDMVIEIISAISALTI